MKPFAMADFITLSPENLCPSGFKGIGKKQNKEEA
jgi:hypothetical protein